MNDFNPTLNGFTSSVDFDISQFSGRFTQTVMPRLALIDDDGVFNARTFLIAKRHQIPINTFLTQDQFLSAPRENFDVIIIDFFLSAMTGAEVANILRAEKYEQPLILISGNVRPFELIQEENFADWISKQKPIDQILWRAVNLYRHQQGSSEMKKLIKKVANSIK